jgi:hypothetical protein
VNNAPSWHDLMPTTKAIAAMSPEELKRADLAIDHYNFNLSLGMAAIGNLLACSAAGDIGLSEKAATNIGWLLECLGELNARLSDTGNAISQQIQGGAQ